MALGATSREILAGVLGRGLALSSVGALAGTVAALALGQVVQSMLFGVSARDPLILCGVALLMLLVTVVASVVPARRASSVDPVVALRLE